MITIEVTKDHLIKSAACNIGRTGENEAEIIQVTLPDDLKDKWLYLEFEKPDKTTFSTPRIEVINGVGEYAISGNLVDKAGMIKLEVVVRDENGFCWKSNPKKYSIPKSIEATEEVEKKNPDFITNAQKVVDEAENLDIDVEKVEDITTVKVIKKDGSEQTVTISDGKDYKLTEEDKQAISDITVPKIETDIQPILNDIDETSDNALEIAKNAENIAKGKSSSVVKDTWVEMEEWLKDVSNKGTHEIGDNLYIKQVWIDEEKGIRQPDYWITEVLQEPNELGYYYNISVLGTEHPDLTDFLEKDEIKEKYLLITYEDGKTETVKLVVYK